MVILPNEKRLNAHDAQYRLEFVGDPDAPLIIMPWWEQTVTRAYQMVKHQDKYIEQAKTHLLAAAAILDQ